MLTVISHFYNEEFLLPYWLRHHTKLFDHGIMIDYQSTDRSVEIIKELAPQWEIRPSRNTEFDAYALDTEVKDIEVTILGWKIALNTTEFLLHHDLRADITEFEKLAPSAPGMQTAGVVMVDCPLEFNQPVDDQPLFFQRHFGWFEPSYTGSRHRLLHKALHGQYYTGRHWTSLTDVVYRPELYCAWFGWSPYPQVKARKMQIQTRIPRAHIGTILGREHQVTDEQMDATFHIYSNAATDLLNDPGYSKALELIKEHLYPEIK